MRGTRQTGNTRFATATRVLRHAAAPESESYMAMARRLSDNHCFPLLTYTTLVFRLQILYHRRPLIELVEIVVPSAAIQSRNPLPDRRIRAQHHLSPYETGSELEVGVERDVAS